MHRATDKTTGSAAVAVKIVAPAVVALPGVAQRLERELKQLERVASARASPGCSRRASAATRPGSRSSCSTARRPWPRRSPRAAPIAARQGRAPDRGHRRGADRGRAGRRGPPRSRAEERAVRRRRTSSCINFSLPVPTSDKVPGVPGVRRARAGRRQAGRSALQPVQPRRAVLLRADRRSRCRPMRSRGVNGSIKPPSPLAEVPAAGRGRDHARARSAARPSGS